jgi:hypothetical protein
VAQMPNQFLARSPSLVSLPLRQRAQGIRAPSAEGRKRTQMQCAVSCHGKRRLSSHRARVADLRLPDAERVFELAVCDLNGLITNDKFCLSRPGRLKLSWSRRPMRMRDLPTNVTIYPSDETVPRGGKHEAIVDQASERTRIARRGAALGSRLSTPSAMEPGHRTRSGGTRRLAHRVTTGGVQ